MLVLKIFVMAIEISPALSHNVSHLPESGMKKVQGVSTVISSHSRVVKMKWQSLSLSHQLSC